LLSQPSRLSLRFIHCRSHHSILEPTQGKGLASRGEWKDEGENGECDPPVLLPSLFYILLNGSTHLGWYAKVYLSCFVLVLRAEPRASCILESLYHWAVGPARLIIIFIYMLYILYIIYNTYIYLYNYFYIFIFGILEFELRALHVLGRWSTTWASPFALAILCLHPPICASLHSWDYRYMPLLQTLVAMESHRHFVQADLGQWSSQLLPPK
jgi:hypothetical protein